MEIVNIVSVQKLEEHLVEIKKIISKYNNLELEKRAIEDKNRKLERQLNQKAELHERVTELEGKVEDARRTKKTLKKVEELEVRIAELEKENGELHGKINRDASLVDQSQLYLKRLQYIAEKLKIKVGQRSTKELLGAIEDAVRKLA